MRWAAVVLIAAAMAGGLAACTSAPAHLSRAQASSAAASVLSLRCSDSADQQGAAGRAVGGVTGLVLPGSDDPSGLYPIGTAGGGKRYFVYKAMLAVSASVAPYATVSVLRPSDAMLVYGSASSVGGLAAGSGDGLVKAARHQVRLPVCGPRFTGFVGGVIVTGPACVTFEVNSPSERAARVSVPIGPARC